VEGILGGDRCIAYDAEFEGPPNCEQLLALKPIIASLALLHDNLIVKFEDFDANADTRWLAATTTTTMTTTTRTCNTLKLVFSVGSACVVCRLNEVLCNWFVSGGVHAA
jgi:hypothetical protein